MLKLFLNYNIFGVIRDGVQKNEKNTYFNYMHFWSYDLWLKISPGLSLSGMLFGDLSRVRIRLLIFNR